MKFVFSCGISRLCEYNCQHKEYKSLTINQDVSFMNYDYLFVSARFDRERAGRGLGYIRYHKVLFGISVFLNDIYIIYV